MDDTKHRIATALFPRIRSLILVLDRQDRLETAHDFVGWREALQDDEAQITRIARHATLRALHVATDPLNFHILQRLARHNRVAMKNLMQEAGMDRIPLHERINELMQVGLAVQELESDDVRATPLTEAVVTLVEGITQELASMIGEWAGNG